LNLTFGISPVWLVVLIIAASALAWWSYRNTTPELPPVRKGLLITLRGIALAIILFLLFEPLLQREQEVRLEPSVSVLVDASQSMLLADSLLDDPSASIASKMEDIEQSLGGMDVDIVPFSDELIVQDSSSVDLDWSGSRTDMAAALAGIARSSEDENLAAVVLVSDGLYNEGSNPIHVAERFPVPILSVVHGDSTARQDVRIQQVITNELAYSGSEVPVQVRIRNESTPVGTATVSLMDGGEMLDQVSVPLPDSGRETTVDMSFEADEPGLRNLRVVLNRFPDEATYRNNEARFSVQVLDQKKSILVLSGSPSPDGAALVRLLSQDETSDVMNVSLRWLTKRSNPSPSSQ